MLKIFLTTVILTILCIVGYADDVDEFDLLKSIDKADSVTLHIFEGWTDYKELGDIPDEKTFAIDSIRAKIKKSFNKTKFDKKVLKTLLSKGKEVSSGYKLEVFSRPKYVFGLTFFMQRDDVFGDDKTGIHVATLLFDEAHNSIWISDLKDGDRQLFYSAKRKEGAVVKYITSFMESLGHEYSYLKGVKLDKHNKQQ